MSSSIVVCACVCVCMRERERESDQLQLQLHTVTILGIAPGSSTLYVDYYLLLIVDPVIKLHITNEAILYTEGPSL